MKFPRLLIVKKVRDLVACLFRLSLFFGEEAFEKLAKAVCGGEGRGVELDETHSWNYG